MGKIYGEIDFECDSSRHVGELEIICNPPWKYTSDNVLLTPEQIKWVNCEVNGNQFSKELTANGSIRFINNGTLPVKPIIKLIGHIESCIKLEYGDVALKINYPMQYDGIAVDCNNETVLRMSDGGNLANYIDKTADEFFCINSGNAEINITASEISEYPYNLTIIIELQPQEV